MLGHSLRARFPLRSPMQGGGGGVLFQDDPLSLGTAGAGAGRKRRRGASPTPPHASAGDTTPAPAPKATQEPWEQLFLEDLFVDIVTINFGKGQKDPVPFVMFYKTDRTTGVIQATEIKRTQVSAFLPLSFEEQILRVYCKRREVEHLAHAAFLLWTSDERMVDSTFYSPSARGRATPWTAASTGPLPLSQTCMG